MTKKIYISSNGKCTFPLLMSYIKPLLYSIESKTKGLWFSAVTVPDFQILLMKLAPEG